MGSVFTGAAVGGVCGAVVRYTTGLSADTTKEELRDAIANAAVGGAAGGAAVGIMAWEVPLILSSPEEEDNGTCGA